MWIVGTNKADPIFGTNLADRISGLSGNDVIHAGAGKDEVSGDGGDDTIYGEDGNDRIVGGGGNDFIYGGAGADIIYGCPGTDRYIYTSINDSLVTARDTIRDFDRGEVIDLTAIGGLTFIGAAPFSGAAGELHYVVMGLSKVRVEADVDGDGAADFAIDVIGVAQPTDAANFAL